MQVQRSYLPPLWKKGHLSKVCNSKKRTQTSTNSAKPQSKTNPQGQPNIKIVQSPAQPFSQELNQQTGSTERQEYTLFTLPNNNYPPLEVPVSINNVDLKMEVDTGAAFSIISENTYHNYFHATPLQPSDIVLRTYSGETITILGSLNVTVQYEAQSFILPLIVVQGDGPSLLGRNWLEVILLNWNHIHSIFQPHTIDTLIERFPSVFNEKLELFKDGSIAIQIIPSAKPKFFKPRPVSYHLRDKVELELNRLQQQGIISPVNFSSWAAPIVPVLKPDDSVRICGDYKVTVNSVLQADTYPLPRIEDLFSKLTGGTIFSKLDLAHAYQQISLNEESHKITTINTHKGLFQYNRLPFGITSAPSIFQRILETLLADVTRVCVYLDDILVSGINEDDHIQTLSQVLSQLESAGFTLKKAKCQFGLKSICYLGHVIDRHGLHLSSDKVKAVQEAPEPKNVTELRAFLGLINYYHKFIPNLSCILFPLYRLLQKDASWSWTETEEKAFSEAKALLQSSTILVHYDPSKPLILSVDASPYGLGAVLSHKMTDGSDKPVSLASRSLSQAEKSYSQIEKEALAIIFGVRKFHQYIHGRRFHIQSDHKPLQYLFHQSKQVPAMASARIQRWALMLGAYNYSIAHKPGKAITHADALSRLPLPDTLDVITSIPTEVVHLKEIVYFYCNGRNHS